MNDEGSIRSGLRLLHRHHEGVLAFDERTAPIRFIVDGRDGRIIAPLEPAALEADQHIISMPNQSDPAIEVMIAPERVEPDWDEGCDRWLAYHGVAREATWVACIIESAKTDRWVFEGDALMVANAIRDEEPKLVRALNEQPHRLKKLCVSEAGIEVQEPLAVGVDPDGIDVKARFGIVRVEFDDADERPIQARIEQLIAENA